MQKQNQQFSFCLEGKCVEGKRGSGKEERREGRGVPFLGQNHAGHVFTFPLQRTAAGVVGACGGGIARGDESTWHAHPLFPGSTVTGAPHSPSVGAPSRGFFFPHLGCSPMSAVHNIQTRTFRLALHSQSNTHSSSSSSSSHRVRTVKNSTTTSDLHQGVHLAVFFLHLPRTCVCTCLCVCART